MCLGGKESWQRDWTEPCSEPALCIQGREPSTAHLGVAAGSAGTNSLQPRQEVKIIVPGPAAKCICRQVPAVPFPGQNSLSLLQSVTQEICVLWAVHKQEHFLQNSSIFTDPDYEQ